MAHHLLGFYGGEGPAVQIVTHAHRTLTPLVPLTPKEPPVLKRAVTLSRLATNTQNWKNFRTTEASRQRCSPHPLVQTIDNRHDTDDEACGGNHDADTDSRGNKIHGVIDHGGLSKRLVPSSAVRKFFPIPAFNRDYCVNSRCKICIAGVGVR